MISFSQHFRVYFVKVSTSEGQELAAELKASNQTTLHQRKIATVMGLKIVIFSILQTEDSFSIL